MMEAGELPHLSRVAQQGGQARVATTSPAQTPVAWSTFATGVNPGGHGIFDFLSRNPQTYLPALGLNRYEQKNPFVPPKVVNLRRGRPVWDVLSDAGIPSTIIRCPCTYPPDQPKGKLLSGMGVPDLRGGFGTSTFYTTRDNVSQLESESVVQLTRAGGGAITTNLLGPLSPKTRAPVELSVRLEVNSEDGSVAVHSNGEPRELTVKQGEWSDWLHVRFKTGMFQSTRGMLRFFLVRVEPELELYASPVNYDPAAPLFPISSPEEYAGELQAAIGDFHTAGMIEDHGGLNNGRIDEAAFLAQCDDAWKEREAMMLHGLNQFNEGMFFCLFDTPDRVQHMFWRFREQDHPANKVNGYSDEFRRVIEEHYRVADAMAGKALDAVDDETLFIALSDHGFTSFQRGAHLNAWLHEQGLLALKKGIQPGEEAGDLLLNIDWENTKAYALGLSGIYLNLQGRESQGIVAPEDAARLKAKLTAELTGLTDDARQAVAIRSAKSREEVYSGPCAHEAPDVIINYADGYRASWS
ncbi:MAG: alkaline phosphatase family protein, partial [Planctomycetales bacterium]